MPVSPGASGMQPRDPCRPWRGTLASGPKPRGGLLALQSLESNPQLAFATRMEDWTSLGQHKRQDRKSTRLNSSHQKISYAVFCLKKKKAKTRLHVQHKKKVIGCGNLDRSGDR